MTREIWKLSTCFCISAQPIKILSVPTVLQPHTVIKWRSFNLSTYLQYFISCTILCKVCILIRVFKGYLWAKTELMESYKSVSVMRKYFNFPEPCTDQAWLAKKTQYWADASVLGYKNTSSSFSCHFCRFLAFIWNLCKVFRKQSWADGQSKSLKDSRVSYHWQQHKTSHTLSKQPFTTDCSTQNVFCTPFGTWPKKAAGPSWLWQGAHQYEAQIYAFSSSISASVHHLLAKTVIVL